MENEISPLFQAVVVKKLADLIVDVNELKQRITILENENSEIKNRIIELVHRNNLEDIRL